MTGPQILSRRLVAFGIVCMIPGIVLTTMYRGRYSSLAFAGYAMLGVGILMVLVGWALQCKARADAQNNATPQVQQVEEGTVTTHQQGNETAMHILTVLGLQQSQLGQQLPPPYPDVRYSLIPYGIPVLYMLKTSS